MKTFFFKINFMVLMMLISFSASQGQEYTMKYDTSLFEGIWLAVDDNKSYELTLQKNGYYEEDFEAYVEFVYGGLLYKENGRVIRKEVIDSRESIIVGRLLSPYKGSFRFTDRKRKIAGTIMMIVNSDNPGKATWKLMRSEANMVLDGWGEVEFDIPQDLEWTKIE